MNLEVREGFLEEIISTPELNDQQTLTKQREGRACAKVRRQEIACSFKEIKVVQND